jgi:[FeFe] hydrogenase H-cluster maturation GTPase HydF
MELLPLGPVVLIDTAGIDDTGPLGELRVRKTRQVLNKSDAAVLVVEAGTPLEEAEKNLITLFEERGLPYLLAENKCDLLPEPLPPLAEPEKSIYVSAVTGYNIYELKEKIAKVCKKDEPEVWLVGDLIKPGSFVVLVIPIDKAAPKGRLILPEQQVLRDVLDSGSVAVTVQDTGLRQALAELGKKPALVITDSQVFDKVAAITPPDIPLTSFSILMARYKGFLEPAVHGAAAIPGLKDGDKVLISEGCTHHRQCEDIGTVKIPHWLADYTGKKLDFSFSSGGGFPEDLSPYKLIIHCGACMLNAREVLYRVRCAQDQGIPFTNYGTAIAFMRGILKRGLGVFPQYAALVK